MKTIIRFLLGFSLIVMSLTSCNTDEPTLDEKKQIETVVTPEMLYGTWVLTEMYSVTSIDSTHIPISTSVLDTTVHNLICDTIIFKIPYDGYDIRYTANIIRYDDINYDNILELSSGMRGCNTKIINNYIDWEDIDNVYQPENGDVAKIAIINGKLVMNTERLSSIKYIFSVFTKQ